MAIIDSEFAWVLVLGLLNVFRDGVLCIGHPPPAGHILGKESHAVSCYLNIHSGPPNCNEAPRSLASLWDYKMRAAKTYERLLNRWFKVDKVQDRGNGRLMQKFNEYG